MYSYNLNYVPNRISGIVIWVAISVVLAIIGGVLVYFLFLKSNTKVSDNLQKVKDLLDFKTMIIEPILKILYLVFTIFTILYSFIFITYNFLAFILILILGPIIVRVIYESALILIMIWKNTSEIAKNTKGNNSKKEEK